MFCLILTVQFCIVTLTTAGYRDITPLSVWAKIVIMVYVMAVLVIFNLTLMRMVNYFLLYLEKYLVIALKKLFDRD